MALAITRSTWPKRSGRLAVESPGNLADDVRDPAGRQCRAAGVKRAHVAALDVPHADEQQPVDLAG
ncbi:MAG TPA: hypothetical protein VFI65_12220, partial [Streptosporangiaceae bacterium]|nr:hypothetical protein [Streptosporangiaceae bacterium]